MKKLLILLLTVMALHVQGQVFDYYPSYRDTTWQKIRPQAFFVGKPDNFTPAKKYPLIIYVHGNGGKGPGTDESLENLVRGFKKCADCTDRWPPEVEPDLQSAINRYQILVAGPNYSSGSYSCSSALQILDSIKRLYPVDTKRIVLTGFSNGGGTCLECLFSGTMTSQLTAVIPIAPVGRSGDYSPAVATKLPVWGFVNSGDAEGNPGGYTDSNKILAAVRSINSLAGQTQAVVTIPKASGHGGNALAFGLTPPAVQQGWYFLNATTNIYEWIWSMDSDNPKLPPGFGSNTPAQIPQEPEKPATSPVIVRESVPAITTTGSVSLLACKSTGYDAFTWTVISVPKTASLWAPYISGAGYCQAAAKFTIEGAYGIKATACKGSTCVSDTLFVTYQKSTVPVPVVPSTYDSSTGFLTFSDGTRIRATATIEWATKKVVVKGEDGIIYNL